MISDGECYIQAASGAELDGLAHKAVCNEAKPVCQHCERHGLPCIYDRDAFTKIPEKPSATRRSPGRSEEHDPPESRARRMLEAKLMHQYLIETGSSIAIDDSTRGLLARMVPQLSFESDAMLYAMYTVSALHLETLGRHEELGAENVASRYFSMAVREHNEDISQISKETADLGRCRQPYTPPWRWLVVTQTFTSTFVEAWERVGPDPKSASFHMIRGTQHLYDMGKLPDRRNIQKLSHLMDRPKEMWETELWDSEIQDAYERTLDYICTVLGVIDGEGSSGKVFRMLVLFPMLVDRRYVELVRIGSPRALAILAHYFALLVRFDHVWWVANVGADEVRAIHGALPDEWQGLLSWPLQAIMEK
ncbi:hypothetical protein AAE478_002239 [Parahypoxylon ruwenzoriense]